MVEAVFVPVSENAAMFFDHYTKEYKGQRSKLDVQAREVVALIGANGSGESAMSKVINGVVVLDGGQLLLDGQPVDFSSPRVMGVIRGAY